MQIATVQRLNCSLGWAELKGSFATSVSHPLFWHASAFEGTEATLHHCWNSYLPWKGIHHLRQHWMTYISREDRKLEFWRQMYFYHDISHNFFLIFLKGFESPHWGKNQLLIQKLPRSQEFDV